MNELENMFASEIIFGGDIITMEEKHPLVEAIAIKDNKIIALGTYDYVTQFKNEDTNMTNLEGNTLTPGFIEPHSHPENASMFYDWINITAIENKTSEDVFNKIKEAVRTTPKGEWVMAYGYDSMLMRDLKALTAKELDEITTDHPLFVITQSLHVVYVNSKALEVTGITKYTKDPAGAHFERYEDGTPTGVGVEIAAVMAFVNQYLTTLKKSPSQLLREQFRRFADVGITSIYNPGLTPIFKDYDNVMYDEITSDDCLARMGYSIMVTSLNAGRFDLDNLKPNSDRYFCTGVKLWYDGSPYTGTAYLKENYLNSELMQVGCGVPKDQAGFTMHGYDEMLGYIRKYHNENQQIGVHAQGDRAIKEIIDMFEIVINENPRLDHRHRIEHCGLISEEDIKRAAKLGLTISLHPKHILHYGEVLRDEILGEERTLQFTKAKTMIDNGIKISLHTDAPMFKPEPLVLTKIVTTRKTQKGTAIESSEAIDIHEAMKSITINAAWQMFKENEIGSLAVGKYADFAILDQNPYKIDLDNLDKINVLTTYISGRNTKKIESKRKVLANQSI